ncbi:hydrogenase accessory protein [Bradyrhizobium sp. UFLA05-153]
MHRRISELSSASVHASLAEAADAAVVRPDLINEFQGRLCGAVITREAESELYQHFAVRAHLMLSLLARKKIPALIAKIRERSINFDRISTPVNRPRGSVAAVVETVVPYHRSQGAGV